MARYAITLAGPIAIAKARLWLDRAAQLGWRVEFKEPKRSHAQNDRMWEMLDRVSKLMTINGRKFDAEAWKCIFMKQLGKEAQFLPTLDGTGFFPTGFRSSDLSVREMSDLQTFIEAWCAEQGVDLWEAAAIGSEMHSASISKVAREKNVRPTELLATIAYEYADAMLTVRGDAP